MDDSGAWDKSVGRVSVFGLWWCRWVGAWTRVWRGGVVLCLCEM